MLCCVGLIGGSVVGQALGGPWTFIGPAAGFGVGLVADMKMMRGFRRRAPVDPKAADGHGAHAACGESSSGCGIVSGLTRILGGSDGKGGREMTLAEIRQTYQTSAGEPPARG